MAADGICPLLVPVGGGHRVWVCPAHSRACVCLCVCIHALSGVCLQWSHFFFAPVAILRILVLCK